MIVSRYIVAIACLLMYGDYALRLGRRYVDQLRGWETRIRRVSRGQARQLQNHLKQLPSEMEGL